MNKKTEETLYYAFKNIVLKDFHYKNLKIKEKENMEIYHTLLKKREKSSISWYHKILIGYKNPMILLHELIHFEQRKDNLFFPLRYALSKKFRAKMEIEAYKVGLIFSYLLKGYLYEIEYKEVLDNLSSDLYLNMISYEEAKKELDSFYYDLINDRTVKVKYSYGYFLLYDLLSPYTIKQLNIESI